MVSSKKVGSKILGAISEADAERLLLDWVTLEPKDAERFLKRWQGLVNPKIKDNLLWYRDQLRSAWKQPTPRDQSWWLFQVRHHYAYETEALTTGGVLVGPPQEISPVEAALYYLQERIGDRAKYCGYEGCPHGHYFVAEKRWQKYCCEECAAPAVKQQKRDWWHEKGKEKR